MNLAPLGMLCFVYQTAVQDYPNRRAPHVLRCMSRLVAQMRLRLMSAVSPLLEHKRTCRCIVCSRWSGSNFSHSRRRAAPRWNIALTRLWQRAFNVYQTLLKLLAARPLARQLPSR
jgi:hypothetical protein